MTYGICHLSIIPLRVTPSHNAEMGSQLLFGDSYEIIKHSEDKEWIFIKNSFDKYEGWIDVKQFYSLSKDYFDLLQSTLMPLVASPLNFLKGNKNVLHLLLGTALPFYNENAVHIGGESFHFEGEIIFPVRTNDFEFLEKRAFQYLNVPYLWGGKSNFGIDCSGFVQQVFRFCGYQLPRDAYQQAEIGEKVSFDELKPGDLAFFNNEAGKVVHVGIILKGDQIVHASGHVKVEMLDDVGIFKSGSRLYSHKLHSIRRVFN